MSQFFFTPLSFQAARNRYRDRLQALDAVVFPDGKRSLLDEDISPEEADEALVNALESRLHQGSVSGNLAFFARTFSGGKLSLDGNTVHEMIRSIADNRELLKRGIRNHFSGAAVGVIACILAAGGAAYLCGRLSAFTADGAGFLRGKLGAFAADGAGFLRGKPGAFAADGAGFLRGKPGAFAADGAGFLCGKLGAFAADGAGFLRGRLDAFTGKASVSANRLAMPLANVSTVSGGADNASFLIPLFALIVAAALILGIVRFSKKGGKPSPSRIGPGIRNEKEALEVLTLAECLADIYRDERG